MRNIVYGGIVLVTLLMLSACHFGPGALFGDQKDDPYYHYDSSSSNSSVRFEQIYSTQSDGCPGLPYLVDQLVANISYHGIGTVRVTLGENWINKKGLVKPNHIFYSPLGNVGGVEKELKCKPGPATDDVQYFTCSLYRENSDSSNEYRISKMEWQDDSCEAGGSPHFGSLAVYEVRQSAEYLAPGYPDIYSDVSLNGIVVPRLTPIQPPVR